MIQFIKRNWRSIWFYGTTILVVILFLIVDHEYEKNVGNKLIIEYDTLPIVDYSIWTKTFVLWDGTRVHYTYLNKRNVVIDTLKLEKNAKYK